jgi:hypothetical protein
MSWRRILLAATMLVSACGDLTPFPYSPDAGDDGSSVDDGGNGAGDAPASTDALTSSASDAQVSACADCLNHGACAAAQQTCDKNPTCEALTVCLTETLCWTVNTQDLAHLPQCFLACAVKVGISSETDPAITVFAPLLVCAEDMGKCGGVCVPGSPATDP